MSNTWSNWSGLVRCTPRQWLTPCDEAEVAEVVSSAAGRGQTVRVCGSGHSFVPLCATDDVLISLDHLQGLENVDTSSKQATIRAGSKLFSLGEALAAHGLALENQGDIDKQALAGAVSTGTHGTGRDLGSISTQVAAVRLVTSTGEIREFSQQRDPEAMRALGISLGACGVITAITVRAVDAYRLHERTWREPIGACLAQLDERIAATRHFEFFWYPAADEAFCKSLQPTDAAPDELPEREGERIDHNYRIFPTERNVRFNEMEYALPESAGPACFAAIRRLMREKHPNVTWPVEYRTVAADALDLSPNQGRATVAISIHQAAELDHQAFFADTEPIFLAHDGRPHWGKLHSLTATQLARLYPQWDHFQQVRQTLDPTDTFLNEHLQRVLVADGNEAAASAVAVRVPGATR